MKADLDTPITYFNKNRFSINEGGTPINIHMSWTKPIGFYIYLFGYSLHWFQKVNQVS